MTTVSEGLTFIEEQLKLVTEEGDVKLSEDGFAGAVKPFLEIAKVRTSRVHVDAFRVPSIANT